MKIYTALQIVCIVTLITFGIKECDHNKYIYDHSKIDSNEIKHNKMSFWDSLESGDAIIKGGETIVRGNTSYYYDTVQEVIVRSTNMGIVNMTKDDSLVDSLSIQPVKDY